MITEPSAPLIGAHMSIAGGLALAFRRGEDVGCTAMQIFTKNANRWQGKPLADEDVAGLSSGLAGQCDRAGHRP